MAYFIVTLLVLALCSIDRSGAQGSACRLVNDMVSEVAQTVKEELLPDVTQAVEEALLPKVTQAVVEGLLPKVAQAVKDWKVRI